MGQAASSQRAAAGRHGNNPSVRQERNGRDPQPSASPVASSSRDINTSTLTNHSIDQTEVSVASPATEDRSEVARNDPPASTGGNSSEESPAVQTRSETQSSTPSSSSRRSRMSRLGSRILPNSVLRGLLNSGEETQAEGQAHRSGMFLPGTSNSDVPRLFPSFASFRNARSSRITRRRSTRGHYTSRSETDLAPDPTPLDAPISFNTDPSRLAWRHRARLSHVRHSISTPISHMFGQTPQASTTTRNPAPRGPFETTEPTEGINHLLPPLPGVNTQMNFEERHELDAVESAVDRTMSSSPSSSPRQGPSASSGSRRQPGMIRSRATRLLRREEQTPLSRVLHLAATAIAAQLSGNTGTAIPSIQAVGTDGLDGPLESLLQGLQQVNSDGNGDNGRDSNVPHVNFLRVFRFVNHENTSNPPSTTSDGQENTADNMEVDGQESTEARPDRRLLTLVVVGVRPIHPNNGSTNDNNNSENNTSNNRLNIESLLRLPLLAPSNFLRNDRGGSGSLLRRSDGRSRFSSRRYSMGGNTFDSHRHHRSQTSSRRQSDAGSAGDLAGSLPTVLSDSPQGPNPPPSTPAEPGRSGVSSAVNTPSRRPSSASAILPQLDEDSTGEPGQLSPDTSTFNSVRQRRRSDSEAARHRGLGSGAARRNGVVEPDDPSPSAGRSWLIYVVGTNLAENHPAFAAPSLFTDVSTYNYLLYFNPFLGNGKFANQINRIQLMRI